MRQLIIVFLLLFPISLSAQESGSGPLFMKHLLGDREFYDPWGIGIDFYTMEQDYAIKDLTFRTDALPGLVISDTSLIGVSNDVQHFDLKLDAWITPFLNVFALVGRVDADTQVDLSQIPIDDQGNNLGVQTVSYDGTVYGAGINLVIGGDHWFASLNNTWTDTSLSGNFDSSVSAFTSQPRIGLVNDKWTFYVGGMYLDTQEDHQGVIELSFPGLVIPVDFSVELESLENWNYAVGVVHVFSPKAHLLLEIGFGDREHTLFNFTYRF
jgi:hypothetical protein